MPKKQPTYEELFAQLERTVAALETGDLPLEEALKAYEQGVSLAQQCQQQLDQAELRIQTIMNGEIKPWQAEN
ncbi:MAG: exodeoxyribonuclease VII small subunit [Herpetosiphon sp.]|nr:exodeoxyribonuclease VII small subunit [Herpetosiphon sp.]